MALDNKAKVIVLGDLNDFHFSPVIRDTLAGSVLNNLMDLIPTNDRYTFIFDGNSQTLDHILVPDQLTDAAQFDIVHTNINFAAATVGSDHDPILASISMIETIYLPIIAKN